MLKRTEQLDRLERRWEADVYGNLSFRDALARFTALWTEARAIGTAPHRDWERDLETDLSIARAVNGLPPA